jgi:hypothetical protein
MLRLHFLFDVLSPHRDGDRPVDCCAALVAAGAVLLPSRAHAGVAALEIIRSGGYDPKIVNASAPAYERFDRDCRICLNLAVSDRRI